MRNRRVAPNVADLLAEAFKRGGLRRGVKRAEAVLLWPQVVGAALAKFTEAKSLQDGVLYVEVADSETAMHLSFQRAKFVNVYAAKFGDYNATYGSLGAVVVLLMWLFVSAYAILLGATINAEAERQTAEDSTTGRPRPMGQRGRTR